MRTGTRRLRRTLASRPGEGIGRRATLACSAWSFAAFPGRLAVPVGSSLTRARTEVDWLRSRRGGAELALFHEFAPSPSGGGHQFLRALARELRGRGIEIENNRLSAQTPACLFNSFNFDFARLRRFARPRRRDGAPGRRPDRRLPRFRRRHGRPHRRDQPLAGSTRPFSSRATASRSISSSGSSCAIRR